MTQARPFTLTITNGNRAQIKAAPTKVTPKADNANQFEDRLRARADLSVAYAGILGVNTARSDVFDALRLTTSRGASDTVEAAAIAKGLEAAGLIAQVRTIEALTADQWPALAYMTSGQVVLVLGQARGDLIVYDKTCPDNRAHVPVSEFAPFFAGLVVRAEAPLARVAETHKTESKPAHWFWGEFQRFRTSLAEIALGSFVANMLAVAVALSPLGKTIALPIACASICAAVIATPLGMSSPLKSGAVDPLSRSTRATPRFRRTPRRPTTPPTRPHAPPSTWTRSPRSRTPPGALASETGRRRDAESRSRERSTRR